MLKEIVEKIIESKLNVRDFKKLLDKYGYSDDPEEISFALECSDLATVADLKDMVTILNTQGYTIKDIEEKLKKSLK